MDMPREKAVVNNFLKQKRNITEQLKLLRSHRNIPEVEEYINTIYNQKNSSNYLKYLIDRYYYNKKNLIKPEKNGLENMGKLILKGIE